MNEEAEDKITNLPDPILHQILSFLEIKDVARTCILSKRWNGIWTSTPILDFQSLREEGTDELMDIVDKVLHLHDTSSMQKLYIFCKFYQSCFRDHSLDASRASRVNLWISDAIARKVKELSLTLHGFPRTFCPLPLFTCQSLITLELNVHSPYNFYIPKHISIPKLKHLKLSGVKFSNEYNNELLRLSSCPVLEDLTLETCEWVDAKNFCISSPSLENLKFINDCRDNSWLISREPGLRYSGLKIHAPRLVSLTYKDSIPKDYFMSSSTTLVEADVEDLFESGYIGIATTEQKIGLGAAAIRFLQVLSHVKVLTIADQFIEALSCVDDLLKDLPTFNNLKQLNLSAEWYSGRELVGLFRSAPHLESLVFNELIVPPVYLQDYNYDDEDSDLERLENLTTGCFSHLKSVCFKKFSGDPMQIWWVKLILEKAKSLQIMSICHSFPFVSSHKLLKRKEDVMGELSSLYSASTSCVLNFS